MGVTSTDPAPQARAARHSYGLLPALGIFIFLMMAMALRAAFLKAGVYAYVDETPIRKPIVDFYKELYLKSDGKTRPDDAEVRSALSRSVYDAIERELVSREARRRGMKADRERVWRARRDLMDRVAAWSPIDRVMRAVRVTEPELMAELEKDVLLKDVGREIYRTVPEPTEEEVEKFYNENVQLFAEPEGTRVFEIYIRKGNDVPGQEDALRRAEAARAEALAGGNFSDLASRLSEGSGKWRGGDLGFVKPGFLPRPMEVVVRDLPEGQVSEIIETRDGYHIVMVAGRRHFGYTPLAEVRESIALRLRIRAQSYRLAQLENRLRAASRVVRYDLTPLPPRR
ncbi:MAG: peptidyl-prolyl cis-trans isomerase [Acidobacteriota bacterium]